MKNRKNRSDEYQSQKSSAFAIGSLIALAILTGVLVLIALFLY